MKKIRVILAALVAVVLTTGCDRVSKEQYQQATNTNDSLLTVALQQGNEIYELSTTLRSVSEQLDQINGQIEISNGEDQSLVDKRNRLMEKLATVQKTIEEKQKALDELQKKYSAQLGQNKVLKQTIDRLQSEVAGYQSEVSNYKAQVAQNLQQIEELSDTLAQTQQELVETQERSEQQQEVINTQDEMLNTAYYIIGDKNQLKDLGLLEGGVLQKKRLTKQGFSVQGFTRIDIRDVEELALGSKKVEIMTIHPASSYELRTQASGNVNLFIKDQTTFWSNSRYLVVKTK